MSMKTNYVDARTPEERANEPDSFVTTATALNKDTLEERAIIQFRKLWSGINKDNQHLTTEKIEDLLVDKIQQAKEEKRQKILAFINSGYKSPASDTGWSIYLDDVEDFINQLSNTK